jgi:hypothetical protein
LPRRSASSIAKVTTCVESGYLRLPTIFRLSAAGNFAAARAAAAEAAEIGERHNDKNLSALGRNSKDVF